MKKAAKVVFRTCFKIFIQNIKYQQKLVFKLLYRIENWTVTNTSAASDRQIRNSIAYARGAFEGAELNRMKNDAVPVSSLILPLIPPSRYNLRQPPFVFNPRNHPWIC